MQTTTITPAEIDSPDARPVLTSPRKRAGIAGQYEYEVTVTYPGEAEGTRISFVHNVYGGPVVMVWNGMQVFVADAVLDRIGRTVTESWIAAFFGVESIGA